MQDIELFWIFNAIVALLLALDLGVLHRKARAMPLREAVLWTCFWIIMAALFCGALYVWRGSQAALEFATGYLIEELLSLDNLFVFVLIFTFFQVPRELQYKVLFWGIVGALITRGVFIFVSIALIKDFAPFVEYGFGVFLIYTGARLFRGAAHKMDLKKNIVLRTLRRLLPVSDGYRGARFLVKENGRRLVTPLLLVLIIVESTDLLFAADSIPAILGVSRNVVVVYTSNIFAILGLRTLYFALSDAMHRFALLKHGLAVILVMIGVKMLAAHWITIPVWLTLLVVCLIFGVSIGASLILERKSPQH